MTGAQERLDRAEELLETAWGIIANAGWDEWSGDYQQPKSEGWLDATLRWRRDYFGYQGVYVPEPRVLESGH